MKTVTCYLCGADNAEPIWENPDAAVVTTSGVGTFSLRNVICRNCGLVYCNPRLDSDELQCLYGQMCFWVSDASNVQGSNHSRLQHAREQLSFVLKTPGLIAYGRALDIGCGEGYFLKLLNEAGWKPYGVEPSEKQASIARQRYCAEVIVAPFELTNFQPHWFDFVAIRHVLEHLPAPMSTLRTIRQLIRPGGWLLVEVPNLHRPMSIGLEDFFNVMHLFNLSPVTLGHMLNKVGFTVVKQDESLAYPAFRVVARRQEIPNDLEPFINDYPNAVAKVRAYKQQRDTMISDIRERLERALAPFFYARIPVAIFGAGFHTYELLKFKDIWQRVNLVSLLDNDPSKQGREIFGYPVYSADTIPLLGIRVIVISSYVSQEEIYQGLQPYEAIGVAIIKLYDERVFY